MRITTDMAKAINDQISYEASSANAYIAIGSWCERIGYDGSAAFFFEQALEENGHMLKFIHYLNSVEAEAMIPAIEKPPSNFESLESTFQFGLNSEKTVTKSIYDLVDMTEKETLFHTILQKFDLLGRDKLAVYQIDQSLASVRSQVMSRQTGQK